MFCQNESAHPNVRRSWTRPLQETENTDTGAERKDSETCKNNGDMSSSLSSDSTILLSVNNSPRNMSRYKCPFVFTPVNSFSFVVACLKTSFVQI